MNTRNSVMRCVLTVTAGIAVVHNGAADLRQWSGSASVLSVGSPSDRVLWNLRPEIALQYMRGFKSVRNLNLDLQVRGRADVQSRFEDSDNHFDARIDKLVLEWLGSRASLAVGMQKVSWGEPTSFDGVDVVNARDFSEPLYTDRELVKLASPALSLQFLADSAIFQFIWTFMARRSPVPQSIESVPVKQSGPLIFGKDMEFAVKAGGLTQSGWDINGYWSSHLERLPQFVVTSSASGFVLELYEPRVFTVGLTATQSVGDLVGRFELALHSDRAVPESGLIRSESASQFVLQAGFDWNAASSLTLTGELFGERWSRESSAGFVSASEYAALGLRKSFKKGEIEVQANTIFDVQFRESLSSGRLAWKFKDEWQLNLDLYLAKTSNGRALARRQLKDLIRSELIYRF